MTWIEKLQDVIQATCNYMPPPKSPTHSLRLGPAIIPNDKPNVVVVFFDAVNANGQRRDDRVTSATIRAEHRFRPRRKEEDVFASAAYRFDKAFRRLVRKKFRSLNVGATY